MRVPVALALCLVLTAPSGAQWQPAPVAPRPVAPQPFANSWSPVSDYVEPGQDEPGYRSWILRAPWRAGQVRAFHEYLTAQGVSFVAPTWQLLRTASDWRRCGAEPFEIPPAEEWPNIVNTLRYVRDYVVPAIGPVEPVSVFRNATLNRCAGGAPESVHKSMSAIDFVPLQSIARDAMIRRLCSEHQRQGRRFSAGLGFYTKMRFHVDSWRYRTWGRNDHGHIACPKVEWEPPVLASAPATNRVAPATATVGVSPAPTTDGVAPAATVPGTSGPVAATSGAVAAPPSPTVSALPSRDPLSPL